MSFDWMSFATGFMERTSEILQERQAEAKQYEQEQKAAAERNAASISRRRAIADKVTGYANYLVSNGVSDEQLQAVIATGPEAIQELTERVQQAVEANNGRPLGSSDVATLISMPEGFTPLDMTRQEFIDQTYGLSVPAVEPQQEKDYSFIDRLFGRDQMARAEGRLRETPYMEGMSVADINRAAQMSDFQQIIPGTFVTFTSGENYDVTEQGPEFMKAFDQGMDRLADDIRNIEFGEEYTGLSEEEKAQRIAGLKEQEVGALVSAYANRGPEKFMAAHESMLRRQMGDAYVNQLRIDLGLDRPAEEEDTGGDEGGDTGGDDTIVKTTLPPLAEQVEEPIEEPTTVDQAEVETPEVTVLEEPTNAREVWNRIKAKRDMLPAGPERVRLSNLMNRINVSTTPIEKALEIFDLANEVPVVEAPQEAETQPAENEVYQTLSEQGVDDTSIALLDSHGRDMLNYVREQGAATDEELVIALSEWGQRNNIVMPFDKSALIYALKLVIDK